MSNQRKLKRSVVIGASVLIALAFLTVMGGALNVKAQSEGNEGIVAVLLGVVNVLDRVAPEKVSDVKEDIFGAVATIESCTNFGSLTKCSIEAPLSTFGTSTRFFYEYPATTTPTAWYVQIDEATTSVTMVEFGIGDGSGAKATTTSIGRWHVAANNYATVRATSTFGGRSYGTGGVQTWSDANIQENLIIPPNRPYLVNFGGIDAGTDGTEWGTNDEGTAFLEFIVLD